MDVGRHFGVSVGRNAAIAIRLAARPSGATMGEIKSHTGQNQYNVFKRLEELGHVVRRNGVGANMRIQLRHRDGKELPLAAEDTLTDTASVSASADERLRLAAERELQRALRNNLALIEPGLREADGGREDAFRDITATDRHGNSVVIELKVVKAGMEAVAQLQFYMGELATIKSIPYAKVRGFLIAPDFQERAIFASAVSPNVRLLRYRYPLQLELAD